MDRLVVDACGVCCNTMPEQKTADYWIVIKKKTEQELCQTKLKELTEEDHIGYLYKPKPKPNQAAKTQVYHQISKTKTKPCSQHQRLYH